MHKKSSLVFFGVFILIVSIVSTVWFFTSQRRENLDYRSRAASLTTDVFLESLDGQTVIEAEHYNEKFDRGGKAWTVGSNTTTDAGFSNGGYITTLPDSGTTLNDNYATTSPQANYRIRFTKSGTHYVWIRGVGPHGSSDSIHVGLDGQMVATADRIYIPVRRTDWNFDVGDSQGFSAKSGTWRVVSDSSSGHSAPNVYRAYRSSSTDSSEYKSTVYAPYGANVSLEGKVRLTNNLSTTQAYIAVRSDSTASTLYALGIKNGNTLELTKKVSGTWTTIRIVRVATALNTWYTLKLTVSGSTLTGYVNGVQKVQATDTQIASGSYIGIRTRYGTVNIDDLRLSLVPAAPISKWVWNKYTMDKNSTGNAFVASINVPTTGDHILNLWMREDGALVDKIILTTNASYPTPSGLGPAESVRTTSTGPGSLSVCTDSLCTGLQSYWNMNETAPSGTSVSRANTLSSQFSLADGQLNGVPEKYVKSVLPSDAGRIYQAAYFAFDANNNTLSPYLRIPAGQSLPARQTTNNGPFTIVGWYKLANYNDNPTRGRIIISRVGEYSVNFTRNWYEVTLNFSLYGKDGSGTDVVRTVSLPARPIQGTGEISWKWAFFVARFDGTTMYLRHTIPDAGIADSNTLVPALASYNINVTNAEFRIGGNGWTSGFSGWLDEIGIWDRALQDSDITRLYNATAGLTYPFDGTVPSTPTPIPTFTPVPPSVTPTSTPGIPPSPTISSGTCTPVVVEHVARPNAVQYVILRCVGWNCSNFTELTRTADLTYTDNDTTPPNWYYYRYYAVDASGTRLTQNSYSVYVHTTTCSIPTSTPTQTPIPTVTSTPAPTNTPIPTATLIPTHTPIPQILSCNTHKLFALNTWYSRDASTWQQPYTDTPVASVQRGGRYLYEIVYKNNSTSTLGSGVALKNTLPSQLVYDGRAVYCGAVPPATCQIADCNRTTNADGSTSVTCYAGVYMTPGYIFPERFWVKVKADAPLGNLTNSAYLQYPYPPTFTSDTCSNTTTVIQ